MGSPATDKKIVSFIKFCIVPRSIVRQLFILTILQFFSVSAALAEVDLELLYSLNTRFGQFAVVEIPDGYGRAITFNDNPLPVEALAYSSLSGMWSFDGADHVWVLADIFDGGNGCTTGATVIRVDSDGAKVIGATPPCEGLLQEVQLTENEIQLKYFTDALRTEFTWYHFNENEMSETKGKVTFASEQAAGSGDEVTRWIGSHPLTVLQEPAERIRFLSIMPEEELRKLGASMAVANAVEQDGDMIFGKGCRPHLCTHEWGAWGIRISDGQPAALLHSDDGSVTFYGSDGIEELKVWVEGQK